MIRNATDLKGKGCPSFAVGFGEVNQQNLNIIALNKSNVFITNNQLSEDILNRFYNSLVTELCRKHLHVQYLVSLIGAWLGMKDDDT